MKNYFEELCSYQEELANGVDKLKSEIQRLEDLEQQLWSRREQALLQSYLGLKNERKEIEYALHYVQEQMSDKQKQLKQLQKDLEKRLDTVITKYRDQSSTYI